MRDLKIKYPHVIQSFKSGKCYSGSYFFGYDIEQEKIAYYNGQTFRSLTLKENMSGYPLKIFMRTKVTGKSIHQRKKKKKKLASAVAALVRLLFITTYA